MPCDAFDEVRCRHKVLILAYVVMPDHFHLLAYGERKLEDVLRLLNGVSARRVTRRKSVAFPLGEMED